MKFNFLSQYFSCRTASKMCVHICLTSCTALFHPNRGLGKHKNSALPLLGGKSDKHMILLQLDEYTNTVGANIYSMQNCFVEIKTCLKLAFMNYIQTEIQVFVECKQ